MANKYIGLDTAPMTYEEKERLYRLLKEKEARQETGGHLVKLFPEEGPYSREHYPRHMEFIKASKDYKTLFFMGANRCLAEGTLVATPKGPVAIEQLKVGDYVFDRYGIPTKVVATWANGKRETVSLCNRGKEYIRCTPDHEIDCYYNKSRKVSFFEKGNFEEKKIAAGDLSRKTQVRRVYPHCDLGDVDFPEAYALGALLGDGCSRYVSPNMLQISSADEKIPSKVAEILGVDYSKNSSTNYTWSIYRGGFPHYDDWCKGKYAHEKTCDLDVVKSWNRKTTLNFVAGLVDTDGSLSKTKDGYTLSLTMQAKDVIDAFSYCVLALWQEPVNIAVDDREKYVNGPVYRASVRNPWAVKRICEELQPYLQEKRKAEISKFSDVGKRSFPNSICLKPKEKQEEYVYDITVEHPEHIFLLANGLAVSNCGKTELGCYMLSCFLTGQYPSWWNGKRFEGPIEAWAASDTSSTTRDILQFKLLGMPGALGTGMLAADSIANVRMKSGVPDAIESVKVKHIDGGYSFLGFKSYDQGRRTFQGTAKHVIVLDEEPRDEGIVAECVVRTMTTDGIVLITATPLLGLTPLVQSFMDNADTPHSQEDFTT